MFDLATAKAQAAEYAALHGTPWAVVETPADALANQKPYNLFNTGRYVPVKATELADYVAGGCRWVR